VVGRPPRPRQMPVKRSASATTTNTVAQSPLVARHPSGVRRAASFRPQDISTPTFQSSTNSLLAEAPAASRMAEVLSTPRPIRHPWRPDDERLQPTRVAPPPPTAQSSFSSLFGSSFEVVPRPVDKPLSNSAVEDPQSTTSGSTTPTCLPAAFSFSLLRSAIEDSSPDEHPDGSGAGILFEPVVRAPPRPRHALNKARSVFSKFISC